jgi:hypothetical protein
MLLDGGRFAREFEASTLRVKLLHEMIPIIRSSASRAAQLADSQLLIDLLKWGIVDAGSMSGLRRTIARQFAKADPEYENPIPQEVTA